MSSLRVPFMRYLIYSQLVFFSSVLICVLIAPISLSANSGMSYFGVHAVTVIPYGTGLLLAAYFIIKALHAVPKNNSKLQPILWTLKLMVPLMAGIVVTPYSINSWFDWIHTIIGATLFSIQFLLAIWIVLNEKKDWRNWLLLVVQTGSGLLALIYLAPAHGLLIQCQLIFQAAFSTILLNNLRKVKIL